MTTDDEREEKGRLGASPDDTGRRCCDSFKVYGGTVWGMPWGRGKVSLGAIAKEVS